MPSSSFRNRFFKVILPFILVVLGVGIVIISVVTKQPPPSGQEAFPGTPVETVVLKSTTEPPSLTISGKVIPAKEVALYPEVSGTLIEVNPRLKPGEVLKEGEWIARIDPRPFENRVLEARANLRQAKANLALELGRNEVAEADWEYYLDNLNGSTAETPSDLALREPQLQIAQSRFEAARAALALAQLNLEFTRIKAPFDCLVLMEQVDVGQRVSPASPIAELVGAGAFWLQAAVSYRYLEALDIPGVNAEAGSRVRIYREHEGKRVARKGNVERLLADMDPQGRMARLLIRVENPMTNANGAENLPLLLNAFARAEVQTNLEGQWIQVPRAAVWEGNHVYVFQEGNLSIRRIEPDWRAEDMVFVKHGLSAGDKLVTTKLAAATEGMKLREVTKGGDNEQ